MPEIIKINRTTEQSNILNDLEHVEHTEVDDEYWKRLELGEMIDHAKPIYFRNMEHDVKATFEEVGLVENTKQVDWKSEDVRNAIQEKIEEINC